MTKDNFDNLEYEEYVKCVGSKFAIEGALEDSKFILFEISEKKSNSQAESFSLFFKAPAEAAIQQGTYKLTNDDLGSAYLFVVPISQEGSEIVYESLFNRQVKG